MKQNKTQQTEASVEEFLNAIETEKIREMCQKVSALMQEIAQEPPKMWGASLVGFGRYAYKYATGRQGEWFRIGFAPRKKQITLYFSGGFEQYTDILARLGKHTIGKSCLHINSLADIDMTVLKELAQTSWTSAVV